MKNIRCDGCGVEIKQYDYILSYRAVDFCKSCVLKLYQDIKQNFAQELNEGASQSVVAVLKPNDAGPDFSGLWRTSKGALVKVQSSNDNKSWLGYLEEPFGHYPKGLKVSFGIDGYSSINAIGQLEKKQRGEEKI